MPPRKQTPQRVEGPRVQMRAWLEWNGHNLMGRGRLELLQQIERCGSISGAARAMGVSYRAAWRWIAAMNAAASHPLVVTATGGVKGGGAQLTPTGKAVLQAFALLSQRLGELNEQLNRELAALFAAADQR